MRSIPESNQSSAAVAPCGAAAAQAERAVLASRLDELELVIAAARLGFCIVQAESHVLRASSQFKAEFGWPPDAEPLFHDLESRMDPDARTTFSDAVRVALERGTDFEQVVHAVWPNGTTQWVLLKSRTVDDGEGRRRLVLTSRNVDGERQTAASREAERAAALEKERRRRSAAEAANRGKDQFLSVFSHELRSPLNAILGWNRILAMKRVEDPEVASITARIESSARSQLKMVNDLLDLGRIETGKLRIEARPMQLAQAVAAAMELARPIAAAKGITLESDFAPGAGRLRGDPDRLQQVVSNLLSNALKFTRSGGRIDVTLRNVGAVTELAVIDTGQGIAPELLPHVFDRFRQGDNSTTRHTGGLGLGLALVREIVTLHGGTVSAHSAGIGQGARFIATFPARQPWRSETAADEDSASLIPQPSLGGLSILVVDDEPDARTVVAETLRLEGARVTVTDSAPSAFRKVQEAGAHYDMIITDIGMPGEDGYSLLRRVRNLDSGRQILAIAVTGYASKADVEAAKDAGFDMHVPKPVDFNAFVPLIRRLADGSR